MSFAHYIKEIGGGAAGDGDLSEHDAYQVFGAMLDGGMPELELGALLLALRLKSESLPELLGFDRALNARVFRLRAGRQGETGDPAELQRRTRSAQSAAAARAIVTALQCAGAGARHIERQWARRQRLHLARARRHAMR
jgi:anthranilate phosphoribosyltransferase